MNGVVEFEGRSYIPPQKPVSRGFSAIAGGLMQMAPSRVTNGAIQLGLVSQDGCRSCLILGCR